MSSIITDSEIDNKIFFDFDFVGISFEVDRRKFYIGLSIYIFYGGSTKTFFRFFRISGPTGSGKPVASILGESLGQEELNGTSSTRIGPADPSTHT